MHNIEHPKEMLSNIIETDSEIIVLTPKRKSWVLIILFGVLIIQSSIGIIQTLLFTTDISKISIISIILYSLIILYFTLKGLLWQLKGVKEIRVNTKELKISNQSPLWSKTKSYNLADVKTIDTKDESVSEGPLAMLQILKIVDKIKITFTYGYETITANSGMDITEANEIIARLKNKIGLR